MSRLLRQSGYYHRSSARSESFYLWQFAPRTVYGPLGSKLTRQSRQRHDSLLQQPPVTELEPPMFIPCCGKVNFRMQWLFIMTPGAVSLRLSPAAPVRGMHHFYSINHHSYIRIYADRHLLRGVQPRSVLQDYTDF